MDPMTVVPPDGGRGIDVLLQENPDKLFVSPTNDAGERWLDELLLRSELPAASALWSWVGGYALHPTHWIVFGVQRSSSARGDYFVYCYPKRGYSPEQLREAFVAAAKARSATPFQRN